MDWVADDRHHCNLQTGYLEVKFASGTLAPGCSDRCGPASDRKSGGGYFIRLVMTLFAPEI